MVTLFSGYSYDGLNDAIGVQHKERVHTGAKSWGGLVTLFLIDGYFYIGYITIGVQHTSTKFGNGLVTLFLIDVFCCHR